MSSPHVHRSITAGIRYKSISIRRSHFLTLRVSAQMGSGFSKLRLAIADLARHFVQRPHGSPLLTR